MTTETGIVLPGVTETMTVNIDSDLSDKEYTFVDFDATDSGVVNAVADSATVGFILQDAGDGSSTATTGSIAIGGVSKLKIAGIVTQGDKVTATTAGRGITTTTDTQNYGAIALASGVTGGTIPVKVIPGMIAG